MWAYVQTIDAFYTAKKLGMLSIEKYDSTVFSRTSKEYMFSYCTRVEWLKHYVKSHSNDSSSVQNRDSYDISFLIYFCQKFLTPP